ncbi:MAG: hypothetical protein HXY46_09325 [Syntrophaceae bacterium]|nr:hypothetical protein [Syntrophaceae bacterium]
MEEILVELYSERKEANGKTAEEILDRLEENKNYIPPSARREYKSVVLKEYRDYVAAQKGETPSRLEGG